MLKIQDKYDKYKQYIVYGTRSSTEKIQDGYELWTNETTEFLIYQGFKWVWVDSALYEPCE